MNESATAGWTTVEIPTPRRLGRPREADLALAVGAFLLGAIAARLVPALVALLAG